MTKLRPASLAVYLAALLGCSGLAAAQKPSAPVCPNADVTVLANKPFVQSASLEAGKKQKLDFVVIILGSVTGRIADETGSNGPSRASSRGISGVKVTLRSRDAGFERWAFEQFTGADGTYNFENLRPGKYTIEIDPADLPPGYRLH